MTSTAAYPAAPPAAAAPAQQAAPSSPLSITSLILGIVSVAGGWTFLAPVAGLVVGILALGREPQARTMAIWGIVLNSVVLAGALVFAVMAIIVGIAALPFVPEFASF